MKLPWALGILAGIAGFLGGLCPNCLAQTYPAGPTAEGVEAAWWETSRPSGPPGYPTPAGMRPAWPDCDDPHAWPQADSSRGWPYPARLPGESSEARIGLTSVPAESLSPPEQPAGNWLSRLGRLAQGRTQLEGGYSYLQGGDASQHALPDLLLRIGLTDRLELRLGWSGYVHVDSASGGSTSDTLDPNVGLALDLWGQSGLIPMTAVLAAVPVPLEGNPFALNSLQPLGELMYAWQTGDRTTLTGRTGIAILSVNGSDETQFQQSLSLDRILSDRWGAFLSWEMLTQNGQLAQQGGTDSVQHMAGGGLTFLLTERLAVTWRASCGLNEAAPDFLNDLRFAYRF